MKRLATVILVCALIAAWVGAQAPRRIAPADQAKLLQRNKLLYTAAVNSGLTVTTQIDPLERANTSTELAKQLSGEIQKAAKENDADRAAELAHHLAHLIDSGVAANLRMARSRIQAGSEAEKTLFERRDQILEVLRPVEESLRSQFAGDSEELDRALSEIAAGKAKLERAVRK